MKPNYLPGFKVSILSKEECLLNKKEQTLYLDYYKVYLFGFIIFKIDLAIKAKGKLDPFAASYIANLLNQKYGIELYHILLGFSKNKTAATENFSN